MKCWLKWTHRRETEMRPQRSDHLLCEVGLIRVPDEADSDDLRRVHEDASDPNLLPTVALENVEEGDSFTQKQLHQMIK